MTLARPYPDRIEELEREVGAKSLRLQGMQQLLEQQAIYVAEMEKANAEMVRTIQARDAEIERLRGYLVMPYYRDKLKAIDGQHDLPPTRAEGALYSDEETAVHKQHLRDGHAKARDAVRERANRIATEANEEREG